MHEIKCLHWSIRRETHFRQPIYREVRKHAVRIDYDDDLRCIVSEMTNPMIQGEAFASLGEVGADSDFRAEPLGG